MGHGPNFLSINSLPRFPSLNLLVMAGKLPKDIAASEIKEFHFHVYFFQTNHNSVEAALTLRSDILALTEAGYFQGVTPLDRVNHAPIGPHPIGSYEVWCPTEDFAKLYSYMLLHRGNLAVLLHPLTRGEVGDHTTRASWLGGVSMPLDITQLREKLKEVPAQYPEKGLGYSKRMAISLGLRDLDG